MDGNSLLSELNRFKGTNDDEDRYFAPGDLLSANGSVYRIDDEAGRGGMAVAYRAVHKDLNRDCVIKVLARKYARERSGVIRTAFEREPRIISQIDNPHVVRVTHVGCLEDEYATPFYTMPLLNGPNLGSFVAGKKLRIDQALNLTIVIGFGLAAIHERGLVHRDMKPTNVILAISRDAQRRSIIVPTIIDFGIALVMDDRKDNLVAGSIAYCAPEQIRGERVGPAADVFALGVMLYRLLTNRLPYPASNNFDDAIGRTYVEAPSLAGVADIPPAVAALVARMLSLDPAARPKMDALVDELQIISNALGPLDLMTLVTLEDLAGAFPQIQPKQVKAGDVEARTDVDAVIPGWMHTIRAEATRQRILGRGIDNDLARAETTPAHAPRISKTVPYAAPRAPRIFSTEPSAPPIFDEHPDGPEASDPAVDLTGDGDIGRVSTQLRGEPLPPPDSGRAIAYVYSAPRGTRQANPAIHDTVVGPPVVDLSNGSFGELALLNEALARGRAEAIAKRGSSGARNPAVVRPQSKRSAKTRTNSKLVVFLLTLAVVIFLGAGITYFAFHGGPGRVLGPAANGANGANGGAR